MLGYRPRSVPGHNAAPTGTEAQAASHRCRPGCGVRRRPAPAADPPGCLGGVRRWRPRFPLTSSASAAGCRVGVRSHRFTSFEPVFTFKTHTTYYGDILTQSNSGKAGPQPSPPGPISWDPEKGERSSLFRVLARPPFNSCNHLSSLSLLRAARLLPTAAGSRRVAALEDGAAPNHLSTCHRPARPFRRAP